MASFVGLAGLRLVDLAVEVADERKKEIHADDETIGREGDVRKEDKAEPPIRRGNVSARLARTKVDRDGILVGKMSRIEHILDTRYQLE